MRPLMAAMCVAAAAFALAPAPAPALVRYSCAQAGSRTLLRNDFARVYYTRAWRPYSCYRLTGRRVPLDSFVDRFYAPRDARIGNLRTTGRVLAYTWTDPGIPAVYVHSLDMRVARFHRRVRIQPLVSADPAAVRVSDLVARRSGSIAWIQVVEGEVSVWRFDRRGRRRLDVGPGIAPISLRLGPGGRARWTHNGVPRFASLV